MNTYEISTDPGRLQLEAIHAYLARSYWSPGIPREVVARAIANSLCFGVYLRETEDAGHGEATIGRHGDAVVPRRGEPQVGFARVVTDKASFAYLADVYVLEEHRGQGLSKRLVEQVLAHPDLQGMRRFLLATRDAHGLYARFGFKAPGKPENFMEIKVAPDWLLPEA